MKIHKKIGNFVGTKELVYSEQFIIADGEDITINVKIDEWFLKLNIEFVIDKEEKEPLVDISSTDDVAYIKLINWADGLNMTSTNDNEFGTTDSGTKVYLRMTHNLSGKNRILIVQFLAERK